MGVLLVIVLEPRRQLLHHRLRFFQLMHGHVVSLEGLHDGQPSLPDLLRPSLILNRFHTEGPPQRAAIESKRGTEHGLSCSKHQELESGRFGLGEEVRQRGCEERDASDSHGARWCPSENPGFRRPQLYDQRRTDSLRGLGSQMRAALPENYLLELSGPQSGRTSPVGPDAYP